MTTTDITPYAAEPLSERMEYARVLSTASDLIPKALFGKPIDGRPPEPSPGKVLLVLETGAMLGLHPIAALQGINVIEGKAAASAALMSGVLRGAGFRLQLAETGSVEGGDYGVTATLTRPDADVFTSTWTPHRAARANLCTYALNPATGVWKVNARSAQGHPLPWENYTESLCKARAVSEVARDGGQDALYGIRYTPEELGAVVDANGEVVSDANGDPVQAITRVGEATPTATPPARKRATNGTQGTKRAKAPAETPEPADEPTAQQDPEADPNVVDAELVEDEPDDRSNPDNIDRADEAAVRQFNETHGRATGHFITSDAELKREADRLAGDGDAARKAATAELVKQAKIDGAATKAKREAEAAEADEREERARHAAEQEARIKADEQAERDAAAADMQTGEIPDEGAETAERIRAERAARGARTKLPAEGAEAIVKSEPEPWAEIGLYDVITADEPEAWEKRLDAATTLAQVKQVWDEASLVEGAMTTALRKSIVKRKASVIAAAEQQG